MPPAPTPQETPALLAELRVLCAPQQQPALRAKTPPICLRTQDSILVVVTRATIFRAALLLVFFVELDALSAALAQFAPSV